MNSFLELRVPPVIQVVLVGTLIWLANAVFPATRITIPLASWLAAALAACGIAVAVLGVAAFRQANTTVDPRAPEQSARVVRTGIYKLSRNPMYVGFFLVLLAWSISLQQLLAVPLLAAFVAYLTRYQIIPEERFLKDKFGNEYIDYCRQVRRWL